MNNRGPCDSGNCPGKAAARTRCPAPVVRRQARLITDACRLLRGLLHTLPWPELGAAQKRRLDTQLSRAQSDLLLARRVTGAATKKSPCRTQEADGETAGEAHKHGSSGPIGKGR